MIYTTKENKMDPIIRIENLIFEYQKDENEVPKRALNNINLQIERGSFTAILGKNGSGKIHTG